MLPPGNGGTAPVYGHALGHVTYERHRPEHTLLDQLIEQHYPALIAQLDAQGRSLPPHVHQEFEAYLKCGRLEHGFLRVRCATCQPERLVMSLAVLYLATCQSRVKKIVVILRMSLLFF